MKIAITSQNKRTITKHAGMCKNFLVYTIEDKNIINKEIVTLNDENTLKSIFHGLSDETHNSIFDCDILLAGSIGQGGIRNLAQRGVKAYNIIEKDPQIAVESLLVGTLKVAEAPAHGHHHGHKH